MSDTWIILGATSSMARAMTRKLAERGDGLILAGRDLDDIAATAADAEARGAGFAEAAKFDARDPATFAPIIARAGEVAGRVNVAVFVGSMPSQDAIDADPGLVDTTITDCFAGPARFLTAALPLLEDRKGTVVGVGSVAGDRGRVGNYVYGASKSGFHAYLSGLRNRLTRAGGHVVTVKPGFVDTAMSWEVEGMFLVAPPEKVAGDILKAVEKRRNVIYTPWFWLIIMTIIRLIPEPIFKKMSI